jgi:hypothetical protein
MFIVILAVVAFAGYVITYCCIVNMVAKPDIRTEETPEVVYEGETDQPLDCSVTDFVCEDDEFDRDFNSNIEEQNSHIALLSYNVNEILSNIDSIIEKNEKQRVVL